MSISCQGFMIKFDIIRYHLYFLCLAVSTPLNSTDFSGVTFWGCKNASVIWLLVSSYVLNRSEEKFSNKSCGNDLDIEGN